MALKFKLDTLDGLDDATKALYKQKGDKFVLDLEGDGEDTAGLKKKVEDLLEEQAKLKGKVKENDEAAKAAAEAARRAAEDAAAKKGDIEALRKSADERVAAARAEVEAQFKPELEKTKTAIRRLRVDNVAVEIASRIGLKGSESLLIPHIKNRLEVEERDGDYVTVVRDANGKASALGVADLEKEFQGNPAFAPVIAGSKGSGGGAGGDQGKGGGASGAKSIKRADFEKLDPKGKAEHMKDGGKVTD
jgi:hypothetical protein